MNTIDKRFFHVCDGAHYFMVARDLAHAQQILAAVGVQLVAKDGREYAIGAPEIADVPWRELSADQAASKRVWLGDDGAPPQVTLAECAIGTWYSSEI